MDRRLFRPVAIVSTVLAFSALVATTLLGQVDAPTPPITSVPPQPQQPTALAPLPLYESSDGSKIDGWHGDGMAVSICGEGFEKTVNLGGLIQLDSGLYHQDATNRATLGDIEDSLGFRRVRFSAAGKLWDNIAYHSEFDIAQSQPRFVDIWMEIQQTMLGDVRIGRFRQPFGMAELTSVKELPFLERPTLFAQGPFRQTGLMLVNHIADEHTTWAVAGYRYFSDHFGNVYGDSGGYGIATRLTHHWGDAAGGALLHTGFGYTFNDPARNVTRFANTNEYFGGQNPTLGAGGLSILPLTGVPAFVNTGLINTNWVQAFDLETAYAHGPFAVQSEVRWLSVNPTAGPTLRFPGAYLHFRYLLTGETIPYQKKTGVFGRVVPNCPVGPTTHGIGAWEVAARISYVDFNDDVIAGRRLTNSTLGLNWYWNRYTKFQWNWIHSQLNDRALGDSHADTLAFRAQVDF